MCAYGRSVSAAGRCIMYSKWIIVRHNERRDPQTVTQYHNRTTSLSLEKSLRRNNTFSLKSASADASVEADERCWTLSFFSAAERLPFLICPHVRGGGRAPADCWMWIVLYWLTSVHSEHLAGAQGPAAHLHLHMKISLLGVLSATQPLKTAVQCNISWGSGGIFL